MKTTFYIDNKTNKNNSFLNEANYSTLLDSIISDHLIKTNSYLNVQKSDDDILDGLIKAHKSKSIFGATLKDSDEFTKAANFLANYGKINTKLPFTYGHEYYFGGNTITFHFDSIEINGTEYMYEDFGNIILLKKLPKKTKKLIIDIYTKGSTDITINLK